MSSNAKEVEAVEESKPTSPSGELEKSSSPSDHATAPELAKGEKKEHWLKTESEHVIPKVSLETRDWEIDEIHVGIPLVLTELLPHFVLC